MERELFPSSCYGGDGDDAFVLRCMSTGFALAHWWCRLVPEDQRPLRPACRTGHFQAERARIIRIVIVCFFFTCPAVVWKS